MNGIRLTNDVTMFFAEMVMLALLGFGGYRIVGEPAVLQWVLGLGLPIIAIAIWSKKLAPKAKHRLNQPSLAAVKMLMFIAAAFVGTFASPIYASLFIFIATLNVIGEFALGTGTYGK